MKTPVANSNSDDNNNNNNNNNKSSSSVTDVNQIFSYLEPQQRLKHSTSRDPWSGVAPSDPWRGRVVWHGVVITRLLMVMSAWISMLYVFRSDPIFVDYRVIFLKMFKCKFIFIIKSNNIT